MNAQWHFYLSRLLQHLPVLLATAVFLTFGLLSPKFLEVNNLINILVQASSAGIVAVGMTYVLLVAGIDLSVGAIMYLTAAIAARMTLGGIALPWAILAILVLGLLFGGVNACFITRFRILPFVVTLATLYLGRGFGLWITETRAMNLPEQLLVLGSSRWMGIPMPILVFLAVLVTAHLVLTRTPYGRQIYAVGQDPEGAQKAGLNPRRILASIYLVSGMCAALGGLVSVAQLGAVSPTFGNQREFAAIAAAVLGGTSLFGGRGQVFPGTVLGTLLIQMIESGLVILNADPYLYPLITSSIIFWAVLLDCLRNRHLQKLSRRKIRIEA
jgi:ribose transport system permease protein